MTTYKEIVGQKVNKVSSDPAEPKTGQMWYNSSTGTLRALDFVTAWSSSSPLTTGRAQAGGNGTQSSALIAGGYTTAVTAVTEEYNGSGWSAGGSLTTSRNSLRSAGTQTSALAFGGYKPSPGYITVTESYNGTSWTNAPSLTTGRTGGSQAGTSTAALYAGGGTPGVINNSEEYNGSSWSEGDNLNTARTVAGGSGIQTAALAAGGELGPPGYTGATELYDGTSWTTSPASLNVIKGGQGQSGTQTSSLAYGGYTGTAVTGATESFDGTTWTNLSPVALATSRNATQGAGADNSSAVCFGGDPQKAETEEFNISSNVITAGAWASGANYPSTIQDPAGSGPITAAAVYGGYTTTYTAATNEYDGSAWTGGGAMNTGRATYQTGTGSQTAALQATGYATSAHTNQSEEYNGSSWTSGNTLTYSRYGAVGGGIQTSALIIGGSGGPSPSSPNTALDKTEEYDGTNWTAGGDLPAAQAGGSGFSGTSSSSAIIAGFSPPKTVTLSYDGSSWTDLGHALVVGKSTPAGGSQQGTTTLALIAGGLDPSPAHTTGSQQYNGTSWVTAPSMSTARRGGAASGTYASCLAVGGESPQKNDTEEFTGETTAVNIKNFSTS